MSDRAERVLAVMQPTFLPWLGYFALITEADVFVFLDDVQFSRQSWQSRNRIAGPNGEVMLSLPVSRKPSRPLIKDARVADPDAAQTLLARAEGCLLHGAYWPEVERLLSQGLTRLPDGLSETNIGLIETITELLGVDAEFMRSSELGLAETDRARRLPSIARALEATTYLSPVGAAGYLREDRPFDDVGTKLRFQNFTHPTYRQHGSDFHSHMSAIDALAWLGPEATRAAILGGIGPQLAEADLVERGESHGG